MNNQNQGSSSPAPTVQRPTFCVFELVGLRSVMTLRAGIMASCADAKNKGTLSHCNLQILPKTRQDVPFYTLLCSTLLSHALLYYRTLLQQDNGIYSSPDTYGSGLTIRAQACNSCIKTPNPKPLNLYTPKPLHP